MHSIIFGMKFSANIPEDALAFLDEQVTVGKYRSRSQAITKAVYMLRDSSLQVAYQEAFSDTDPVWDAVVADGLDDDQW
jgi:Arc/MetJ-type ribon-helix-helix transcriptional regulator